MNLLNFKCWLFQLNNVRYRAKPWCGPRAEASTSDPLGSAHLPKPQGRSPCGTCVLFLNSLGPGGPRPSRWYCWPGGTAHENTKTIWKEHRSPQPQPVRALLGTKFQGKEKPHPQRAPRTTATPGLPTGQAHSWGRPGGSRVSAVNTTALWNTDPVSPT